jgi:hypothetical protein
MPRKATPKSTPIPATSNALLDRFKDFPAIEILTRRFNDPSDPGSLPILLKDEAQDSCHNSDHQNKIKAGATTCHLCHRPVRVWYVRYANTSQEGRWSQIKSKGYIPVEIHELKDEQDVSDLVKTDTWVRRGDRGQEVLVKMPLEAYIVIKRRERAKRKAQSVSINHQRAELAEAAGRELGSEAGDMIHDGDIKIESMTRRKATLAEESELVAD